MKLSLNTLPRGRSEQIFDSIAQLQHDASVEWKPLKLEVVVSIDHQERNYYLQGRVTCTGLFICNTGLEEFEDTIKGEFDIILTHNPKHLDEHDNDELILLPPHQIEFDLYPLVHDTILLGIPISHSCGPDCAAGKALQQKLQMESKPDDRWAKLKDLFQE